MLLINKMKKKHICDPAADKKENEEGIGETMTISELKNHLNTECKLLRYCQDCDELFDNVDYYREHLEF
jgi:hypothetical protein